MGHAAGGSEEVNRAHSSDAEEGHVANHLRYLRGAGGRGAKGRGGGCWL